MSLSNLPSHGPATLPLDLSGYQQKNAGLVTASNANNTVEADRAAGGIQVLGNSRYGGSYNAGKGVLIAALETGANKGALRVYSMQANGGYPATPMLAVGETGDFAELFGSRIVTVDNVMTINNKKYNTPRETSYEMAGATNYVNVTWSSRIKLRPNGTITLNLTSIDDASSDNHSCLLMIYPLVDVTFAAVSGLVWGTTNGAAPTLAAGKIHLINITHMYYAGHISRWLAVQGPTFAP